MTGPCVVCQDPERVPERGQVCEPCRLPLPALLRDIADIHAHLDLTPGSGGTGPRVSGSHEPPLPLRVDAVDLTMPARGGTVHDDHGDQVGHPAVATVLDQWVRDWRDTLDLREGLPVPTVPVLCRWLADRLDKACQHHPAVDEFVAEMRRLRSTLRAVSGDAPARPQRLPAPCSYCDQLTLVRVPARGERPVCCGLCGRSWTEEEYVDWVSELAYALRVPATNSGRVAA